MKILMVAPYITSKANPALMRNQTGFGYMVHDIAQYVGKKEEVDLFLVAVMVPEIDVDGFHILGQSWGRWLKNFRMYNLHGAIRFLRKYPLPVKDQLRTIFYCVSMGQIERRLKDYDIVHVHGCGVISDAVINICKLHNKPFVVTLHGLNSFEASVRQHPSLKRHERDFLLEAYRQHYPVTFISTGIMRTAEEYVKKHIEGDDELSSCFIVVCNGCDVRVQEQTRDIRKEFDIVASSFVFACVGNISENKNQLQVARAYSELPFAEQDKVHVLFVGKYSVYDEISKYIEEKQLARHLHLCGVIDKADIHNYYQSSNATVLASQSEGFGLSIIEGYANGLPSLTFNNMAAIVDLYDDVCMITVDERSDKALAEGMELIMNRTWDREAIKKKSENFSLEFMVDMYIEVYQKVIDQY